MGFLSYSTTPATNTTINGINIAEGCPASGVNDALRQLAADGAALAQLVPTWVGTTTGSANAYVLTPSPAIASYVTGQAFRMLTSFANTAASPTINISGLGAKVVYRPDGGAAQIGDLVSGALLDVVYDGTGLRLVAAPGANIGDVRAISHSTVPPKWLLSYGQAVSRTTYAALFAALSTTYGTGDGSTTFNLPDLRGRLIAGKDDMGGSNATRLNTFITSNALGSTGGDQNITSHAHTQQGTFTTGTQSANHTHSFTIYGGVDDSNFNSAVPGQSDTVSGAGTGTTGVNSVSHTHSVTISGSTVAAGAGAAGNVQPSIILNYIIYAAA